MAYAYQYKSQDDWARELAQPRVYGTAAAPVTPETTTQPTQTRPAAAPEPEQQAPTAVAGTTTVQTYEPMERGTPELWPSTLERPTIPIQPYAPSLPGFADLFAPVTTPIVKGTEALGQVAGEFTEAAGPYRTWEQIQGPQVVQTALRPEGADAARYSQMARELAETRYTGPTALAGAGYDDLQGYLGQIQDWQTALGTPYGTQELLRQQTPSLTPGERVFESRLLKEDPLYREALEEVQRDIGGYLGQVGQAEAQAAAIGERRTGEESEIQRLARELVQGEIGAITTSISDRMAQEKAREEALDAALAQFQADPTQLAALQPFTGKDVTRFNTEAQRLAAEMGPAKAAVMAKYPDLADIPMMVLSIDSHGMPSMEFMPQDEARLRAQHGDAFPALRLRAIERQKDMEGAGFSPGAETISAGAVRTDWPDEVPWGKYSLLDPMYYYSGLPGLPKIQDYISVAEGSPIRRETVATQEEREVYNRAAEILGLVDQIPETTEPYKQKELAVKIGKYLQDEEAWLEQRKETLTQAEQAYRDWVHNERRVYLKAKRRKKWGPFLNNLNQEILTSFTIPAHQKLLEEADRGTL